MKTLFLFAIVTCLAVVKGDNIHTLSQNVSALWEHVNHMTSCNRRVQLIVHTHDEHEGEEHASHEHGEDSHGHHDDDDAHVHLHLHMDHHHHGPMGAGGHGHGDGDGEGHGHGHGHGHGEGGEGHAHVEGHDRSDPFHHNPLPIPPAEANQFVYASCFMQPNRLPRNQRQNIRGTIDIRQRRHGGPMEMKFDLQGFDTRRHEGTSGSGPGNLDHRHAFHVHEFGDVSRACNTIGSPFDPPHPPSHTHHGDQDTEGNLGVIECDATGRIRETKTYNGPTLVGLHTILGRSLAIHASASHDHGAGRRNSNPIVACCTIGFSDDGRWGT